MKLKTLFAGLAMIVSSNMYAADIGVGVKAGTLGMGVDISVALTQKINARLSLTKSSYDFKETITLNDSNNNLTNQANVDATLDLDFGATAILFDWYVFDGTFHLTGGFVKNSSSIDLNGRITDASVTFNGQTYDVANDFANPNISGSIKLGNSIQPYLGIGWGRKADDDPGLSVSFELGVVLLDPEVDLRAPVHTNSTLQTELDNNVNAAEVTANDEVSVLEVWPVISLGLNYAF